MKNNLILFMLVILTAGTGCQPEDVKEYSPVENGGVSSLYGTWKGQSVNQRDKGAEDNGFPYKNEDMTAALGFANVKVTLNGTASTPSTFTIDYGTAPQFFKFNTGNWKVDNVNKVGKVYLIKSDNSDTITMVMGSYQDLLNNRLSFTQTKTLLGSPAIIYEFKFSK